MTELKSCPGEMPRSPLAVSAGGLIDDRAGRAGRGEFRVATRIRLLRPALPAVAWSGKRLASNELVCVQRIAVNMPDRTYIADARSIQLISGGSSASCIIVLLSIPLQLVARPRKPSRGAVQNRKARKMKRFLAAFPLVVPILSVRRSRIRPG